MWLHDLRALHDSYFSYDWDSHVRRLNRRLGLTGRNEFGLPAPTLPPAWFVGDVEALVPGKWVLVISLNQARREEDEAWHRSQRYTPQTYWDHWRWLNRNYWEPRFYRPLVRLAATALGTSVGRPDESAFATDRMVFVELCPYASRQFEIADDVVRVLGSDDIGFRVATQVRRLLVDEAKPAVVLVNGAAAVHELEVLHEDDIDWSERRYPSVAAPERTLWHKEGHWAGKVPVVGFPFLRKPRTHNSYAEIEQLGTMARGLVTSRA